MCAMPVKPCKRTQAGALCVSPAQLLLDLCSTPIMQQPAELLWKFVPSCEGGPAACTQANTSDLPVCCLQLDTVAMRGGVQLAGASYASSTYHCTYVSVGLAANVCCAGNCARRMSRLSRRKSSGSGVGGLECPAHQRKKMYATRTPDELAADILAQLWVEQHPS